MDRKAPCWLPYYNREVKQDPPASTVASDLLLGLLVATILLVIFFGHGSGFKAGYALVAGLGLLFYPFVSTLRTTKVNSAILTLFIVLLSIGAFALVDGYHVGNEFGWPTTYK